MSEAQVLELEGSGGEAFPAWHWPALPAGFDRSIVLLHDVFGLDACVHGVGQSLSERGYRVLAPDLYFRDGLPGPAGSASAPAPAWTTEHLQAAVQALPDRRTVSDIEHAGRCLLESGVDPEGLIVLGLGRGGTLAFLAGCQSHLFQAVATFDGEVSYEELGALRPVQPFEMALNLQAPLVAHFAGQESALEDDPIEKLGAKLDAFAKVFSFYRYGEAAPGFAHPHFPRYHEVHAKTAWERTFGFLDEVL